MVSPEAANDLPRSARERYRRSIAELASAQKAAKGASAYSRYVNRPVGRRLAAAAHVLNLTANQVTILSGLLSFAGVALIVAVPPTVPAGIAISLALLLGYAMDSADGQLARLRGTGGRAGEWLDHVVDCAVKLGLHGAVLIAWYRSDVGSGYLALAFAFQFVAVLLFFGGALADTLRKDSAVHGPFHDSPLRQVTEVVRLFVDHATVALAFLLWGWPDVFVVLYAVLLFAHAALLIAFGAHWFQELS